MSKVKHTERLFSIWPSLLRMSLLTSMIPDFVHADRISWSEMFIGRPVTTLLWVSDLAYSVSTDQYHCPIGVILFLVF